MAEEEKKLGRPKKEKPKLTNAPIQFVADEELGITDMQAGFVWHYTEDACGQTEAARRAGFSCLLYTSPSPRDRTRSRMPSSA